MIKKCLTIIIFVFIFQTPSQADDIRDLQIEGMSIGDSLLDYFSKNEMKKFLKADTTHFYNNSDYVIIGIYKENQNSISLNNYESLGITINKKDIRRLRRASLSSRLQLDLLHLIEYTIIFRSNGR